MASADCLRTSGSLQQGGFTLVELVMVILILGVLSAYAAPRMFNSSDFYARGFHDETLALLRYAQKAAVAQRRTVCVAFVQGPPASASLTIESAQGVACAAALTWPNKNCTVGLVTTACIEARSGVGYAGAPSSLRFNGLGQPLSGLGLFPPLSAKQTMTVANGTSTFTETVEAETGYVHE